MKKVMALFTALTLVLGLCACSIKVEEPTWQEKFELGVQYLSDGNYEEAILAFNSAIGIDPKQADTYEKLADAYLALDDTDAALQALRDGYAAVKDAQIQARIDKIASPEPTPTSTPKPTPKPTPTPISRADLYPMNYIGMTIDSLAELWGADYQTDEGFYEEGAKPIYYEDGRISMMFFVWDTWDEHDNNYGIHGDDKIMRVRVYQTTGEVAPGIPTRATYPQLMGTGYSGKLFKYSSDFSGIGPDGQTAEYALEYSPDIFIYYYWYDSDDPETTQAKRVEIWKSTGSSLTPTSEPTLGPTPTLEPTLEPIITSTPAPAYTAVDITKGFWTTNGYRLGDTYVYCFQPDGTFMMQDMAQVGMGSVPTQGRYEYTSQTITLFYQGEIDDILNYDVKKQIFISSQRTVVVDQNPLYPDGVKLGPETLSFLENVPVGFFED